MMLYELQDHRARPIALAEAADPADVEMFAIREVSGFHRAVLVPAPIDHEAGLEAGCRRMGLSESAARIAARGRPPAPGLVLPRHRVPRPEARQAASVSATPTIVSETTVRRSR